MKPMVPPAPEGPIDSIRQPYMENIRCWSDVAEILKRELISQQKLELITENHVCFHPLKTFGEVWNIHKTALKNFVTLLCGYLQFPFILLQNPCKTHTLDYEEMLRRSPTLSLLSVALYEIGLTLDEVPTFDICSLFSDEDLSQMDEENRDRAVEESYALVEGVLRILRPRIVIVCQCVTNQGKWKSGQDGEKLWSWKPARNPLARELCSSLTAFRNYEVQEVSLGNHVIYAVKGRHPIGVIRYDDEDGGGRLKFQALIRQMFVPCANIQRLELAEALTKFQNSVSVLMQPLRNCNGWRDNWQKTDREAPIPRIMIS
ncbi:hypothetical protein MANI_030282 [Metarhizium anisopliae]|nr:hypothetical protein MANI_030282 [Metarhizium anisopliae]